MNPIRAAAVGLVIVLGAGCPRAPDPGPGCERCEVDSGEPVCEAGQRASENGCVPVGWSECPAGFRADPSGWGCEEVLPECDAGLLPRLGAIDCARVGASSCVAGFEPDPTTSGCRAILPAAACSGATRDALGQTACAAVGDCGAPFPPANATLFVDDSFTAGQLDATHFATIGAAVAAAPSAAVIAIESGSYAEPLALGKPVTLVGRCAAQVILSGASIASPGLEVTSAGVSVSGVTISGFNFGVRAPAGASVAVEDSVLEQNHPYGAFAAGGSITLRRSVIRSAQADATSLYGVGAVVSGGGTLQLEDASISGCAGVGILASGAISKLSLLRSVIRDMQVSPGGNYGRGIQVQTGATVAVNSSAIVATREDGIRAQAGTVTVVNSVIDGVVSNDGPAGEAFGLAATTGASVSLTRTTAARAGLVCAAANAAKLTALDSTFAGCASPSAKAVGGGVNYEAGASGALTNVLVTGNYVHGLAVLSGAQLTVSSVLVEGTKASGTASTGEGLVVQTGGGVSGGPLALRGNTTVGAWFVSSGTTARLDGVLIDGMRSGDVGAGDSFGLALQVVAGASVALRNAVARGGRGSGLVVSDIGSALSLENVVVRGTREDASDGGVLAIGAGDGASATVTNAALVDNVLVGLHAQGPGTRLTVRNVVVRGTRFSSRAPMGRAANVQWGASGAFTNVAFVDNRELGLLSAADAGVVMSGSLISGTLLDGYGGFGDGAACLEQGTLSLDDVTIAGQSEGIGVLFASGTGVIQRSRIERNAVGLHVQDGSNLVSSDAPPAQVADGEVTVVSDTKFIGNATRLGTGAVPLPSLIH